VLYYSLPTEAETKYLIENAMGMFRKGLNVEQLIPASAGLSHAEIVLSCIDAKKEAILIRNNTVDTKLLEKMFRDRHSVFRPDIDPPPNRKS
jgi:hypothetical protein